MLMLERFVGARIFDLASNFHESQIKRRITMMKRHQSGKRAWIKPLILLPVITLLALAFAKPRVNAVSASAGEPAMVSAAPVTFPFTPQSTPKSAPQQKIEDGDKKKIAEYEKKIQSLKTKYMELEKKKEAGGDVKKIEEEQKKIKKKVSALSAELKKMTGSEAKDYPGEDKKKLTKQQQEQYQKEKQKKLAELEKKKQEEQLKKEQLKEEQKKEKMKNKPTNL
jgi:hypothetical protein